MIDNNIIQSLGAGSGIDTKSIVSQLVEIEKAAPQERIDTKRDLAESQISDFGLIRSAMSLLQESVETLIEDEALFSKSASFTDSDALSPSGITTEAQVGSYAFEVDQLAQAQSINFAAVDDPTDSVGEGTITFAFGTWTRETDELLSTFDDPLSFTADGDQDTVDITIDSSNNSLNGLRDAINDAEMGVQASIIFDGSGYRLSLMADSGASSEIEMSVVESGGAGLSDFAYNETDLIASELASVESQKGQDAILQINGLEVTRSSNVVDDVVEGLTVDLLKASPGETVTVTITDDKTFAEDNVRNFVDAYNAFLEAVEPAFGYDEETEERGSLANDSLGKSVLSQLRNTVATAIPGLASSNYTSLTNIGIRTELDGTLSIDEDDFSTAFDDNFEDVQKLLAPLAESTGGGIEVNSYGTQTVVGNYEVIVTTQPEKGLYTGNSAAAATLAAFPIFDTTGKTYEFVAEVNGITSGTITVPTDVTYTSGTELASAIQSAINGDDELQANSATVVVTFDTDHFVIESTKFGAASDVNISGTSAEIDVDLGIADGSGTQGTDVAGTIDGEVGFGLGHVLLGALGSDTEGLSLLTTETATTSTVNFSRGFAGELDELVDQFLLSNGLFDARETNLESRISTLDDEESNLERRMTGFEERMLQQFIAMENILNGLNSSGSFLENLINTLPFTASNN